MFSGDSFKNIQEDLEDFLADPLGIRPFPVIVGGDSERIYYATNLSDISVNFPGPSNDLVIPGFYGPSNLYKYEDKQREMIRPLVPAFVFGASTTDGFHVIYLRNSLPGQEGNLQLVACDIVWSEPWVLFDAAESDPNSYVGEPVISSGRVAFVISAYDEANAVVRVVEVTSGEVICEIEVGWWSNLDLKGNLLAYQVQPDEGPEQLFLLDLASGDEALLLSELPLSNTIRSVHITDNKVVWDEWTGSSSAGIKAYDISSGTTETWIDAISGTAHRCGRQVFSDPGVRAREQRYHGNGSSSDCKRSQATNASWPIFAPMDWPGNRAFSGTERFL